MYREQARVKSFALDMTSMSYCSPQGLGAIKEGGRGVCKTDGKEHFTSVLDTTGDYTHELTAGVAACPKTFPRLNQPKFQCRSRRASQGFTPS